MIRVTWSPQSVRLISAQVSGLFSAELDILNLEYKICLMKG